jgi:class 3 adenylate cyclase
MESGFIPARFWRPISGQSSGLPILYLIGDTVNLASKIQELNKEVKTDILVSLRMYDMVEG